MILIELHNAHPIRIVDSTDYVWEVPDGDLVVKHNGKIVVRVPVGNWKYITDLPADLPTSNDATITYPGITGMSILHHGTTTFNADGTTTHTR